MAETETDLLTMSGSELAADHMRRRDNLARSIGDCATIEPWDRAREQQRDAILHAARQSDEAGKREAAREALTKLGDAWNGLAFNVSGESLTINTVLHASARMVYEFRDKHYPLPPRECVRCALCDQSGADLSTGTHATRDECIEALGAALKSFAAGVGR